MITPETWFDSWLCTQCGKPRGEHKHTVWCTSEAAGAQFNRKTMPFAGMMRIKNEARWIERVVTAMLPLCEHVFILDDHSTDETVRICRSFGDRVTVYESPYEDFDESRDKNALYDEILPHGPDWIACFDGDEVLLDDGPELIRQSVASGASNAYSPRIVYLWDNEDQARVDEVYGRFAYNRPSRPSLFKVINPAFRFQSTPWGGNMHCSSIPQELIHGYAPCPAVLLHLGYMHRADRVRKLDDYTNKDANNIVEDRYRHMCQGDAVQLSELPMTTALIHAGRLSINDVREMLNTPPEAKLLHAGPLALVPLESVL